jgi:hypothetical protein
LDVATAAVVQLTDDSVDDDFPEWSPDGTRVAFEAAFRNGSSTSCIWTVDVVDGTLVQITDDAADDYNPTWSPDGTQIAFRSNFRGGNGAWAIYVKDLDVAVADGYTQVTFSDETHMDYEPSWGAPTAEPISEDATLTVGSTVARAGETVVVPIQTTDVTGLDVLGITLSLTYDPALLTPTTDGVDTNAVALGEIVNGQNPWLVEQNVSSPGQLEIAMAGDVISSGGALAYVSFDVAAGAVQGASSVVRLSSISMNEGEIVTTAVSGTFTVVEIVYGDVTGNGAATSYDSAWILNYVVNAALIPPVIVPFRIEEITPTWSSAPVAQAVAHEVADVDVDAAITALDAALILKLEVGLILSLPAPAQPAPGYAPDSATLHVAGLGPSVRPGADITVFLDASDVRDLYAGEFRLEFDPALLEVTGVALDGATQSGAMLSHRAAEGQVAVAFASARGIESTDRAVGVTFRATTGTREPREAAIHLSHLRLNGAIAQTDFSHTVRIEPFVTRLMANYPNPFNPETWIPFELSQDADVTVHIYGLDGGIVRTLDLGHHMQGEYRARESAAYWDGRNQMGERVASGVYVYELLAGDHRAVRRMVIGK